MDTAQRTAASVSDYTRSLPLPLLPHIKMEVHMRNDGGLDSKSELSQEGLMPLNVATVDENGQNDFPSYEKSIVDEIDSYMEDLNDLLTVSRMVTDSVIKGMVNAIEEDCAEKISLKEEGISKLCNKFLNHDAISDDKFLIDQFLNTYDECKINAISVQEILEFSHLTTQSSAVSHIEYVNRLRIKTEEWIEKLKMEAGNANQSELSQADTLPLEVGHSRIYPQTESIPKFHIVDIDSLEKLLTEMSTYLSAVISSDRTLTSEQESKKDFPIDLSTTLLQNLTGLHHEYETEILDQQARMIDLMQKWQKISDELATLRRELFDIYSSFVIWEFGSIFPHINPEILEERNPMKRKDRVQRKPAVNNITAHEENSLVVKKDEDFEKPISAVAPQLTSMSKEELINHFKNEMVKMNRQHEAALQEETEKVFSLKREFLKEKGSSHFNFKKDKEVELVRKRISEIVSKLDDIILENKNLSSIHDNKGLCSLREKINAIFSESQHLVSLLAAKYKDPLPDCFKVLHTVNQLPNLFVGGDYANQVEVLQCDIEALKFEMSIKDAMNKSALQELYVEIEDRVEGMEMETKICQCTYSFVLGEVVRDALSRINTIMIKCIEENKYFSANLLDKDKALFVEAEENKMLKQQIESSSTLLKAKEILASDLEANLIHLNKQFESTYHEHDVLRDLVTKQELVIAENRKDFDLLDCTLKENFHQHQAELDEINLKFKTVLLALQDAEKQNSILQFELMDIQANLASKIKKEKEQKKLVQSILTSMSEFEDKVNHRIEHNESRLKVLICQSDKLSEQAGLVKEKLLWYKEVFERRCEDLQKAETEVDLLGDEVDNLVSLLGKIYLALEHYSSVLQYYPGVMEVLKLIRREIEASKSF